MLPQMFKDSLRQFFVESLERLHLAQADTFLCYPIHFRPAQLSFLFS